MLDLITVWEAHMIQCWSDNKLGQARRHLHRSKWRKEQILTPLLTTVMQRRQSWRVARAAPRTSWAQPLNLHLQQCITQAWRTTRSPAFLLRPSISVSISRWTRLIVSSISDFHKLLRGARLTWEALERRIKALRPVFLLKRSGHASLRIRRRAMVDRARQQAGIKIKDWAMFFSRLATTLTTTLDIDNKLLILNRLAHSHIPHSKANLVAVIGYLLLMMTCLVATSFLMKLTKTILSQAQLTLVLDPRFPPRTCFLIVSKNFITNISFLFDIGIMSLNEIENGKGWATHYNNQGWMTNPASQQDFSYRNLMMANPRGRPLPG